MTEQLPQCPAGTGRYGRRRVRVADQLPECLGLVQQCRSEIHLTNLQRCAPCQARSVAMTSRAIRVCHADCRHRRLLREAQRVSRRHDADGLAIGTHEADLGYPDPVVDTKLGADVSSWRFGDWGPGGGPCSGNAEGLRVASGGQFVSPVSGRCFTAHWTDENQTGPDDLCTAMFLAVDAGGTPGRPGGRLSIRLVDPSLPEELQIGQRSMVTDYSDAEPIAAASNTLGPGPR